jgi:predicted ester cyclase
MSEMREALINRIYAEAYAEGNLAVLDEAYAEGYVRHQPPVPSVEGLEAYRKFISDTRGAYSGLEFAVDEIINLEDRSVVRVTLKGKHTGQAPTILAPPTGKEIEMAGCVVSHWEGGKIAVDWVYNDYLGLVQQFGIYPPPGMFA